METSRQVKQASQLCFRYETELVEVLERSVRQHAGGLAPRGCNTIRELLVGRSIPDFVLWWSDTPDLLPSPGLLSTEECVLLSFLRQRVSTRIDVLERLCGAERGAYRNGMLSQLQDRGLLERGEGGSVKLSAMWPPPVKVVAFEAKLERWRTALRQAETYRRFADQAYVALPRKMEEAPNGDLDEFAARGIGLLAIDSQGIIQIREAPAVPSREHDWRRDYVLSRIMALVRM